MLWTITSSMLLLLLPEYESCVPTATVITPDPVCCPILSQTSLPRRPPSSTDYEQCSIVRRVSSNCPVEGYVFCDAAPDTNPTTMQIEFFDSLGTVVRTIQRPGTTLGAQVLCVAGSWLVQTAPNETGNVMISQISCAQTGSTGADFGFVVEPQLT